MSVENPTCPGHHPSPVDESTIAPIVEQLCDSSLRWNGSRSPLSCRHVLPSRDVVIGLIEALRSVVFPGYFGTSELSVETMRFHVGATLDGVLRAMEEQVMRGFCFDCAERSPSCAQCRERAREATQTFLSRLPAVQHLLSTDAQAAYEGDPAASSPDEAIFCYPGVLAITSFRLAHELYALGVPLLPRIITEHAHSITGVDIHPGATIGENFFIDHATGVVIGETCVIGKQVRIYQGVTLGAKSFPLDDQGHPIKGIPRHPIVEDDVIIYSGATILGRVTIGKGSTIGGNVWLTHSVPPGSRVMTRSQDWLDLFAEGTGI